MHVYHQKAFRELRGRGPGTGPVPGSHSLDMGRFKDQPIRSIPTAYLLWAVRNANWLTARDRQEIEEELRRRENA